MRGLLLVALLGLAGCNEPAIPLGACGYLANGSGHQVLVEATSFNSEQAAGVLLELRQADNAEDKYSDGPVVGSATTDENGCARILAPTEGWHAIATTWADGADCGPVGFAEPVKVRGVTPVSLEWGYACT